MRLSVREFAAAIGKSPGYVSRIEVRGELPSPMLICEISEVLKLDAEELLTLAKASQLRKTEEQIKERHSSALSLFRKSQED